MIALPAAWLENARQDDVELTRSLAVYLCDAGHHWTAADWAVFEALKAGLLSIDEQQNQETRDSWLWVRTTPALWNSWRTGELPDLLSMPDAAASAADLDSRYSGDVPPPKNVGGRPRKWDKLLEVNDELLGKNAKTSRQKVVNEFHKRYPNSKNFKRATPTTLTQARSTRKRARSKNKN